MKISYFAKTREIIGRDYDIIHFPTDIRSINDVVKYLSAKGEPYSIAFANQDALRFALDNEMAKSDVSIENIQELAIFPPVTGG